MIMQKKKRVAWENAAKQPIDLFEPALLDKVFDDRIRVGDKDAFKKILSLKTLCKN